MDKFNEIFTPQTRRYIYGVLLALWPALAAAGVNLPGDQALWLAVAAAVLGIGQTGFTLANTMKSTEKTSTAFNDEVNKRVDERMVEELGIPGGCSGMVDYSIVDTRGNGEEVNFYG